MQFVLHELLNVSEEFKALPQHAETDADTINAVLEEGGKFAAEVIFPINISGYPRLHAEPGHPCGDSAGRFQSRLCAIRSRWLAIAQL
jgi:hypothetical protein